MWLGSFSSEGVGCFTDLEYLWFAVFNACGPGSRSAKRLWAFPVLERCCVSS